MILETPMISHIMNIINEKEIDTLMVMPWVNAQVAYLLVVWLSHGQQCEDDKVTTKLLDPTEYAMK